MGTMDAVADIVSRGSRSSNETSSVGRKGIELGSRPLFAVHCLMPTIHWVAGRKGVVKWAPNWSGQAG